jgi:hypothetical protein
MWGGAFLLPSSSEPFLWTVQLAWGSVPSGLTLAGATASSCRNNSVRSFHRDTVSRGLTDLGDGSYAILVVHV